LHRYSILHPGLGRQSIGKAGKQPSLEQALDALRTRLAEAAHRFRKLL
jgi:hypothetical protein